MRIKISSVPMLIPLLIVIGVFFVFPTGYTFYLSLFETRGVEISKFVGLDNYIFLLNYGTFLKAITNTFIYMIGIVSINFLLALGWAHLTYKPFKGVSIVRAIIVTPMLFIPAAACVIWNMLYQPEVGLINHILEFIGFKRIPFLSNSQTALLAVMITDIWGWTPFVYLILLAGLQSLPKEPFEAAELDGASSLQKFRYITLPMLKGTILIALLIKAVDTFKCVEYPWIMTKGGPGDASMILGTLIYRTAFVEIHLGLASAMAGIFFLLSLFLTVIILYYYIKRGI